VIADQDALESGQDILGSHGSHGLHATLAMCVKEGPLSVGEGVQPMILAADVDSGLIGMQ